jgi:WW domain binding protein 11
MPRDKERSVNPAQQQRKLDKAKALKKGKAELQARRNEKLARMNPDRLQRQIDDLKLLEQSGNIRPKDKQILEELEKDLRAVRKAREALGEKAPQGGNKSGHSVREGRDDRGKSGILGKREWNGQRKPHWGGDQGQSSGSETDESVRRIPMPRDTPPPIPQRRNDRRGTNANAEPVAGTRGGERQPNPVSVSPEAVLAPPRTTYESAPQIRDLRKEAIGRFVPNVVRKKQEAVKGTGGLLEPEELDRLESEGYLGQEVERNPIVGDAEARRLAEEEYRFRREMRHVEMQEVEDEHLRQPD